MLGGRGGLATMGIAAAALGAGLFAAVQATVPAADPERARIEAVVREYILAHPEIIPEAVERLQARETAKLVSANRTALTKPYAGGWAGNAQGDVTVVQFFDYNCGFCRASLPAIDRLIAEDKSVKIVFREMPILSEDSVAAARASLIAAERGKFVAFHHALYEAGRPGAATIAATARKVGFDASIPSVAAEAEIASNMELARSLQFTGTPSWVIGDVVFSGQLSLDQLRDAVKTARGR